MSKWGGRRAKAWTAAVLATYGTRCLLQLEGCTQVATEGDHIVPRSVDESLQYVVSNGRPSCPSCNKRRGTSPLAPVIVDPLGLLRPLVCAVGLRPILPPGPPRKGGTEPTEPQEVRS